MRKRAVKLAPLKPINEFYLYVINPIPAGLIHCALGELYYRAGLSSYSSDEYMEIPFLYAVSSFIYSFMIGFFTEAWIRFKSSKNKWKIRVASIILFNSAVEIAFGRLDGLFNYDWIIDMLNTLLGQSIVLFTAYALLRFFTIAPCKTE